MKHFEVREKLIGKTVEVIANQGLDKTTTKAIVKETGINEAYIYRFFADKEDLLAKTFSMLDDELFETAMKHVSVMYMHQLEYETRCRVYFSYVWRFMLDNREKCIAYIRYYYSQYFAKYSAQEHKRRYEPLKKKFEDAFKSESNTWMLMNHILNVMTDFAVKVFAGELSDSDSTTEHVFRLIYNSVYQYFKKSG